MLWVSITSRPELRVEETFQSKYFQILWTFFFVFSSSEVRNSELQALAEHNTKPAITSWTKKHTEIDFYTDTH